MVTRVSSASVLQPLPLINRSNLTSQARMARLMCDSSDLMNDMAAASLNEIHSLASERKQCYADKQIVDAEVDESCRKVGQLDQFDTFFSCVQVAASIGLSLTAGNPMALASAAVGAVRLFDSATGWITNPTLKAGLKWLAWGTGAATFLSGPIAGSNALKSAFEPGLTGASVVAMASRGASDIYRSRLELGKARAGSASKQFRANLSDLSLRKEAAFNAIEEGTAVHQGSWDTVISAMDQAAAARRRIITGGRS